MNNKDEIKQHLKVCLDMFLNTSAEIKDKIKSLIDKPNIYKENLSKLEELLIDIEISKLRIKKIISVLKRNLT